MVQQAATEVLPWSVHTHSSPLKTLIYGAIWLIQLTLLNFIRLVQSVQIFSEMFIILKTLKYLDRTLLSDSATKFLQVIRSMGCTVNPIDCMYRR